MLSSLPKLADKTFILGFFLPTLLFLLSIFGLFGDQEWSRALQRAAFEKDAWDKFAYFVLGTWALSVMLMLANHAQLQILEGYRRPISKFNWLSRREQDRFKKKNDCFAALDSEWARLGSTFPMDRILDWKRQREGLVRQFPPEPGLLLPTRFGNAIRAFELYSREIYGADSIPLWLHLSTVIPKEPQAALEDARAQVNCVVNVCFFAAVVAVVAAAQFLWSLEWNAFVASEICSALLRMINLTSGMFLLTAVVAGVICRLSYLFAIELVFGWGDLVKAAFDCYLPALAQKLGYTLPETAERRKAFWVAVSEQAIFWKPMRPDEWKPPDNGAQPTGNART